MKIDESFPGISRAKRKRFAYDLIGSFDNTVIINGIGLREEMIPCWNRRNKGNSDYLILFFYNSTFIKVGNGEYNDAKGKWIILSPGTPHYYGNDYCNWNHSWIHFTGDYVEELLLKSKIPFNTLLDINVQDEFEKLLISLHEEIYYNNPPILQILKNLVSSGLLRITRSYAGKNSSNIPKNYTEIRQLLDFKYNKNHKLEALADIAGCSVPYFCKKFKEIFQIPPVEYLVNRRIKIAKHLLKTTNFSISEIGIKVGYEDQYYFSKFFKRKTGYTPSSYRIK